jgi:hypothetical protein
LAKFRKFFRDFGDFLPNFYNILAKFCLFLIKVWRKSARLAKFSLFIAAFWRFSASPETAIVLPTSARRLTNTGGGF